MKREEGYKYVLIADDDPAILRLLKAVIEAEGYVTVPAADGKQAYNVLKSGPAVDAAIVDVMMPYINGTDLLKFMRSDKRFENIPVIIMTAEHDPRISSASLRAGAVAFLPKPFSNARLKTILKSLVSI